MESKNLLAGTSLEAFWQKHPVSEIWSGNIPRYFKSGCQGCGEVISEEDIVYHWLHCGPVWHLSRLPRSMDNIIHPCHPTHPLMLLMQGPPNYSSGNCNLCQRKLSSFVYHCKLCDFSVDMKCVSDPPPLIVEHPKCHQHALTLMGRDMSFTCNSCGTHGERNPYICLPCSLMFHYDCVDRPHVISINRHDHRISHQAYPLRPGDHRICEICRQSINWRYGAYSCNKCLNFFAHSKCATNRDVWNGKELDGVPEEELVTTAFRVIDEGIIKHFSHWKHNLFLIEEVIIDGGEGILCQACSHPISFERYYSCMQCEFILHEKCADLPLQRRHAMSTNIFSLRFGNWPDDTLFRCDACLRYGFGFRYEDWTGITLDVHCASLYRFKHHKLHPHTLFLTTLDHGSCVGCDNTNIGVLHCMECEYSLGFCCATLPVVIKHKCDEHYLFLSSGEKTTGKYWCEICEAELNPKKWFYTCYDCGVVCHIKCITGETSNIMPGFIRNLDVVNTNVVNMEVVLNNHNTRSLCSNCGSRCRFPMVFNYSKENIQSFFCSFDCFSLRRAT